MDEMQYIQRKLDRKNEPPEKSCRKRENKTKLTKLSNGDAIRAMSDEELACELLDLFAAFYEVEWSKEVLFDWLKQEANDAL